MHICRSKDLINEKYRCVYHIWICYVIFQRNLNNLDVIKYLYKYMFFKFFLIDKWQFVEN